MSRTHTTRSRTAATRLSQRLRRRRLSDRDRQKAEDAQEPIAPNSEPPRPTSQR